MDFFLLMRFLRTQHWVFHVPITVFVAHPHFDFLMALILPIVFCQQAFLFAVNDYFDRDIDARDPNKKDRNVISAGLLPLRQARIILAGLILV